MHDDVVRLAQELIALESEVHHSNEAVSAHIEALLVALGFEVERLTYAADGTQKVNLVGKLGRGEGGLGFFGHSDTVPGGEGWLPYQPAVREGRLWGRGSADMKGALACMLVALSGVARGRLRRPVFVGVTSDEENGHRGAKFIADRSQTLQRGWPAYSVVGEPTELRPVYAHKGGRRIRVVARGVAAHTSTDRGLSANFLIAPFLAEMAELRQRFQTEERFLNREFDPPTNGFNMVLDDGGCAHNVTAACTVCTLSVRLMPGPDPEEVIRLIVAKAQAHGFEVETSGFPYFSVSPEAEIVRLACRVTGVERAATVPYGTEAEVYQAYTQPVVLGPGSIAQAHTVDEWIALEQLARGVEIYRSLVERVCM